ncbi:hypothetical protein FO519_001888 [Halicephalobus sp. NKZ332]|nr:hypothetical protein FO519_001888 [Halicephalobus sp. NKZ332]
MRTINWLDEKITTREWLKPEISLDSILFAIQHLGLTQMNVLRLEKNQLTKREIYGFIAVSKKRLPIIDPRPFIPNTGEHLFGPTQFIPTQDESKRKNQLLLPQNIKNAEFTINLVNYALMASTTFGERCGSYLKTYFGDRMERALGSGTDLTASVIPIAFSHNYTAKMFPAKKNEHVYYFMMYKDKTYFDKNEDRILLIDPSGELVEFHLSDSGLLHFCKSLEESGCNEIYAIVEDNSKELVEQLAELRQQMPGYDPDRDWLNNSSFLNQSTTVIDTSTQGPMDPELTTLSDLAELTAISENFIEASDYDLIIEDEKGNEEKGHEKSAISTGSDDEEYVKKKFLKLIKEVSDAKHTFSKLWFEGMENYELVSDPEFDSFYQAYRLALREDPKEVQEMLEANADAAIAEVQKELEEQKAVEEAAKENIRVTCAQQASSQEKTGKKRKLECTESTKRVSSMAGREDALDDLKQQLEKIRDNNRNQIQLITLIADDYHEYAEDIVKLICSHIRQLPGDRKLLGIYVMDSILKFSGDSQEKYRQLFGKEFQYRSTCHGRGSNRSANKKDAMREDAGGWGMDGFAVVPITTRYQLHKVRSTWPPVFPKSKLYELDMRVKEVDRSWPIARDISGSGQNGLVQKKEEKKENKPIDDARKEEEKNLVQPSSQTSEGNSEKVSPKTVSPEKPVVVTRDPARDPRKKPVNNNQPGNTTSPSISVSVTSDPPSAQPPVAKVSPTINPEKVKSPPQDVEMKEVKQEPIEVKDQKEKKKKSKKRVKHEERRHKSPERLDKKRRIEEPHIQPTAALGAHAFLPNSAVSISSGMGAMPLIPPGMPQVKNEVEDSWRKPGGPPSFPSSSVITNETPTIGFNANNRIFVDGRAYEVYYVNDEAVIEQNGLPHRISFVGPPRDILVDGKPFRLHFGEDRMINIDGVPYRIRFGAPSRELYVGDHPFKGAFGGPPMIANINGRKHEFRLCGAPPEVRIDKDPSYELTSLLNRVKAVQQQNTGSESGEKMITDVRSLLKKVKESGILTNTMKNIIIPEKTKTSRFDNPVTSVRMDIARMDSAPQALKDFQINALMVRYRDNVDALHKPRIACNHCGISFPDFNSEAYHRHIDMHVQELLRANDTNRANYKPFFMSFEDWLQFDEQEEVLKTSTQEASKAVEDEGSPGSNMVGSPSDPIASTNLNKFCPVCHEKFNQYYDNEEDEWRFQDCVVKGNNAVHRYCVEQLGEVDVKMEEETTDNSFLI